MTISDLLEQPCNRSDNAIKLAQLRTSSANTTCRQLVNRFVTRKKAQVVTGLQTSCYKPIHKLSTTVFALFVPSCCNKLGGIIRLVTTQGCSNKSDTVMI